MGEIDVTLTRDTWTVRLRALVVENLGADIFGGTVFLHDNDIATRQKKKEITVAGKHKVYSTDLDLPLPKPIQPSLQSANAKNSVITIDYSQVLLPEQTVSIPVHPTDYCDGDTVVIGPRDENKNSEWPPPQLSTVSDSKIQISNKSNQPVQLGKDVRVISINKTEIIEPTLTKTCWKDRGTVHPPATVRAGAVIRHRNGTVGAASVVGGADLLPDVAAGHADQNISLIQVNVKKTDRNLLEKIGSIHRKHANVFHQSLANGYNGAAGAHSVKLRWAENTRPPANKIFILGDIGHSPTTPTSHMLQYNAFYSLSFGIVWGLLFRKPKFA